MAEKSKFSAAAAPLKTIVSLPASPSTLSLPSPGSHVNESSPAPISARSAPPFPSIASFSLAAAQHVVAVAAVDGVVAGPAVQRQLGERGKPEPGVERVVAGEGLDGERLRVDHVDRQAARPAGDGDVGGDRRRCHADRVVSGGALDDDAIAACAGVDVQLVVRGLRTEDVDRRPDAADRDAAANPELVCSRRALDVDDVCSPVVRQVGVELAEPGTREVVDDDVVGAAQCPKVESLDACDVDSARREEPQPLPVGRERELLRGVRAVEDDEVTARAALDQVPATLAVDRVVADAAEQPLGCGAAAQQVVAGVTEEARRLRVGEDAEALVDRERVGAGCAVNDDPVEGRAIEGELGETVGADVHLESGLVARLQPQRNPLAFRPCRGR